MAGVPIITGRIQFYDPNTGKPVSCGSVATYEPGTTTPKATYSDAAATTPNANPVALDNTGSATFYGIEGENYKFVVSNVCNEVIATYDPVGFFFETNQPGSATTVLGLNDFDESDRAALYDPASDNDILGVTTVQKQAITGNASTSVCLGLWGTVEPLYVADGKAMPANCYVRGDTGFDLFRLNNSGDYTVNPESDTNVDVFGVGDNWTNLTVQDITNKGMERRSVWKWDSDLYGNYFGVLTVADLPILCSVWNTSTNSTQIYSLIDETKDPSTDPLTVSQTDWILYYDPSTETVPDMYIKGLEVEYNTSSSIKINTGVAKSNTGTPSSDVTMRITTAHYKDLTANYASGAGSSGSPTGGKPSSVALSTGWYRVFEIADIATTPGTTDVQFGIDVVTNALNLRTDAGANFDYWRRIGWVYYTGSVFQEFIQNGNYFEWATPKLEGLSLSGVGSAETKTITAPPSHPATVRMGVVSGASICAGNIGRVGDTIAPVSSASGYVSADLVGMYAANSPVGMGTISKQVLTNSSSQVDVYFVGTAPAAFSIDTLGWQDYFND